MDIKRRNARQPSRPRGGNPRRNPLTYKTRCPDKMSELHSTWFRSEMPQNTLFLVSVTGSKSEETTTVWRIRQCPKKSSRSGLGRNHQHLSFGYRLNVGKNHQCLKKSSIPEEIINVGVLVTGSMSEKIINVWRNHRFLKKLSMSGYRLQAQCLETINRFLELNQTDHTFRCSS